MDARTDDLLIAARDVVHIYGALLRRERPARGESAAGREARVHEPRAVRRPREAVEPRRGGRHPLRLAGRDVDHEELRTVLARDAALGSDRASGRRPLTAAVAARRA